MTLGICPKTQEECGFYAEWSGRASNGSEILAASEVAETVHKFYAHSPCESSEIDHAFLPDIGCAALGAALVIFSGE